MNDGTVQVLVPPERLTDRPSDDREAHPPTDPPPDHAGRLAAAEIRAELAERRADEIREERDRWRDLAEKLSESRSSVGLFDRLFGRR